MKTIKIGLIGVGGYGKIHLDAIRSCEAQQLCTLKAVAIRSPEKYLTRAKELQAQGVKIYSSYEDMLLQEQGRLDLLVIPTGIAQHAEQSIAALEHGFHVLCEKPVAGIVEEAVRMKQAKDQSGKILAIGYQDIVSPTIQRINTITQEQSLGKLLSAKTMGLFPRDSSYYGRNNWAGKMEVNGVKIFDSPLQNPGAHNLNNMLYIAGSGRYDSAFPVEVYGENYRANKIEAADTQFIRIRTDNNIPIVMMVSFATEKRLPPFSEFFYKHGKISWQRDPNGKTQIYSKQEKAYALIEELDNGDIPLTERLLIDVIDAIHKTRKSLANIDNSLQHTLCINGLFESSPEITEIDERFILHKELKPDDTPRY